MSHDAYDDLQDAEDLIGRLTTALSCARATLMALVDQTTDSTGSAREVIRLVGEAEDDGKGYCRASCTINAGEGATEYSCPTDCGCPGPHEFAHGEERE